MVASGTGISVQNEPHLRRELVVLAFVFLCCPYLLSCLCGDHSFWVDKSLSKSCSKTGRRLLDGYFVLVSPPFNFLQVFN